MKKIVNITDQLEAKRRRDQMESHRQKLESLHRTVQCSSCHFKCAMCGYHLDTDGSSCPPVSATKDFNLCETCQAEFDDYLKMMGHETSSEIFWHNKEWMRLWSTWLEYQKAVLQFKKSREFRELIKEFD
jgi:hypothetical protein